MARTETKSVTDASRRAEAMYHDLLEAAPDAIVTCGADGRIQLVNVQAERMFGYTREELIGQPVELLIPEQLRARHVQQRAGYAQQPHPRPMGLGLDFSGRRQDGSTFPAEISLSPLTYDGERLVTAVIRDVSERKAAEAERLRADAAENAVRKRDEFVAVAAHELKTPLTNLLGYTEMMLRLRDRGESLDTSQCGRFLQVIASQARKLNQLVEQLLDVSRIEGGKLEIHPDRCDLVHLVTSVSQEAQARTTQHTVVVVSPPSVVAIVDCLRIEQVLNNLVDNAVKYSPDGGEITLALSQPSLDTVRLAVRDRGLGIPEEHRDRIFDRYYQAHGPGHRMSMGLGLYISRQIVELHGGTIAATFPADGGTEMVITLPSSMTDPPST
jgi:protein-histidine pros-kinase